MKLSRHWFLRFGLIALALGGACSLQIWRLSRTCGTDTGLEGRLSEILPKTINGVSVRDENIASTAEMKRAVAELLNYDDAVCRVYEWSGIQLTVYIAAWGPGKMSPRLVAGHTPDVCWPAAGWVCDQTEASRHENFAEMLVRSGLDPGVSRVFTQGRRVEYMVFWHRIGKIFVSYGSKGAPPWWAFIADVWRDGITPPRSQRFYRISANVPLESIWDRTEIAPLRAVLPALGLATDG